MSSNYPGTQPDAPITEKQVNFINTLADERGVSPDDVAIQENGVGVDDLTRSQASALIDTLKSMPRP